MLKPREEVEEEIEFSLRFVSGDKGYVNFNDFLEFHRNIYWVQPKENNTHYLSMIKQLWGFKDYQ